MPKRFVNHIQLKTPKEGNERRLEMLHDILDGGTFMPKTVVYKDIDEAFKEWVEEKLPIVSDEGKAFPTITLYSNQRFSEYSQTWQHVDENKNILLNFKAINRENNPQYGDLLNKHWLIPDNKFYLSKRMLVLDDNGTESFLDLRIRQPMPIDLVYNLTVFTTKFDSINDFNLKVNTRFKARQDYLQPNGYYMSMTLESIKDSSEYNISDRQFYAQTYTIKVHAFIFTEDDFRVTETPLKVGSNLGMGNRKKKADVELEEIREYAYEEIIVTDKCGNETKAYLKKYIKDIVPIKDECEKEEEKYYYQPVTIKLDFPPCNRTRKFQIPVSFTLIEYTNLDNVLSNIKIKIDGLPVEDKNVLNIPADSEVEITITQRRSSEKSSMELIGYNPDKVLDMEKDDLEFDEDENFDVEIDETLE